MNRFDRITAILIQLQSKKIVKAQDIADRFNISLRTVYRDIRSLEEAGIPIHGEPGIGYSIMEGYRLPPVMFSPEEARTFITAEKLMAKFTDQQLKANFQSAMFKIRSVLRSAEKDLVDYLEDNISVSPIKIPFKSIPNNVLDLLLKSISTRITVRIDYAGLNHSENTNRIIEPIGLYHEYEFWYTIAWCQLRKDYRHFRIDRIKSIRSTDQPFQLQHASLDEHLEHRPGKENLKLVEIRATTGIMKYFTDQKYYWGFMEEKVEGKMVRMKFLTPSLEGFARWYLMFADEAEILYPEELQSRVRELTKVISNRIRTGALNS